MRIFFSLPLSLSLSLTLSLSLYLSLSIYLSRETYFLTFCLLFFIISSYSISPTPSHSSSFLGNKRQISNRCLTSVAPQAGERRKRRLEDNPHLQESDLETETVKYRDNRVVGAIVWHRNRPKQQPIRTRYLGHVTGYQPIRDQYFSIRSVPDVA
eukprot:sb/3473220/